MKNNRKKWFSASIRHLRDPVIVTNAKQSVIFVNPSAAQLLRQDADTLLKRSLHSLCQFFDSRMNDVTLSIFSRIIESGTMLQLDHHFLKISNSGKKHPVRVCVTCLKEENSPETWITFILQPFRKKSSSRFKLKIVNDNFPLGVLRLDENGNVLAANVAGAELLELNRLEHKKIHHLFDIPSLQHPIILHHFRNLLNQRQKCDFDSPLIVSAAGKEYYFRIRGIPRTEQSHQTLFMILIGNISERKKVEYELREREAQLAAIVKAFDGYGYITNQKHQLEYMNERLVQATGYNATGQICYKSLYQRQSPCPWCQNSRVFLGETVRYELQNPTDNRWYYVVNSPIFHANGHISNQAMILDITDRKQMEQALKTSEENYRSVVENANEMIMVIQNRQLVFFNAKVAEITEFPYKELRTLSLLDFVHPDDQNFVEKLQQQILSNKKVQQYYGFRLISKSKKIKWLEANTIKFLWQGEPATLNFLIDISGRKEAEIELQKSEIRYRGIVEDQTELICRLKPDGTINFVNGAFCRFFHVSCENCLESNIANFLKTPDTSGFYELINQLTPQHPVNQIEIRVPDDGWQLWNVRAIFDPNGSLIEYQLVGHEITDQKAAATALSRTAERLRILHEIDQAILAAQSPESIAAVALRCLNKLIPCWRSSVLTINYPKNEVLILAAEVTGSTQIKTAASLPLDSSNYLKHLKPGKIINVKDIDQESPEFSLTQILHAEGLRSFMIIPLVYNEKLIGALNLGSNQKNIFTDEFVDIASEVAAVLAVAIQNTRLHEQVLEHARELEQRVAERTHELEAFSYSVSHDLRTPLRAIDGFSQILLDEYQNHFDQQGKRLLSIIRMNTQKMGHLIDALLSFSRLSRQKLAISKIDVNEIVQSVFEELREVHTERKIILNYGELPDVTGDPIMIRQVFINLIGNAIKFTQQRPVSMIEVGCKIQKNQNLYYVTDNGAGFDMRYADKLFELFQSVHSPEKFQGTGVGLAIVKRIIERHGGRVWAEAKLNEGATFYFLLPGRNKNV